MTLMQRPWKFLIGHRNFINNVNDSAVQQSVRLSVCGMNQNRYCSTYSTYVNVSSTNENHKQWSTQQRWSLSVRTATVWNSFQLQSHQHPFQQSQQLRQYTATRSTNKTRHSKNMIDRLYEVNMFKTDHSNEIPSVMDYAQNIKTKPPPDWLRESWKQQFCIMVPRDKRKTPPPPPPPRPPPTKIVDEYHYNDTPTSDSNTDGSNQLVKTLSVIGKDNMAMRRNESNNVRRQVHRGPGKSYSKTTSIRRTSNSETFTSVTTMTSSSFGPDMESDSDDEINVRKFFSDSDDDENFFEDSDDDEEHQRNQKIIDMPTTASRTTKRLAPDATKQRKSSRTGQSEVFSPSKVPKKPHHPRRGQLH